MTISRFRRAYGPGLLLPLVLAACALISPYDPTSYKNATDLKAEALLLMDKAKDPPAAHAVAIDGLLLKLQQAYEYERGKGDPNRFTVRQWGILMDPDRDLLGGFLRKWRGDDRGQSPAFVGEKKKQVGKAFDQIIELERGKVKD